MMSSWSPWAPWALCVEGVGVARPGMEPQGLMRHDTGGFRIARNRPEVVCDHCRTLVPLCRTFAAYTCATSVPAAVCGLGWCSLRRGNYKANTTLTVLNLRYNKVGDAGAVALAAALKATAVTCTHEFREDALVSCSPMRLKQLMRLCSCFSCCFLCLKGTAHHDVWHR